MKRFIARKNVNYKIIFIFVLITLFILIYFSLKNINFDHFSKLFYTNVFGFQYDDIFYKNIFGFSLKESDRVVVQNNNIKELILDTEPFIYIYNTYQTDKYVNSYYHSYNINSVVTQASFILQEYFKNYHISSIVETNSVAKTLKEHNISYSLSYRGSRILMEHAKKNNPSLDYFIDLGMSDDSKESTTITIDGIDYARILFIIGTENASYEENRKLANELHSRLENMYPGISRGISLRGGEGYHGIYNQDFSSHCLLIYVGGKENKLEEVNRSLKYLAEVIYDYLEDHNGN